MRTITDTDSGGQTTSGCLLSGPGPRSMGTEPRPGGAVPGTGRRGPINTTDDAGHGALTAIGPQTGEAKWEFRTYDVSDSGVLTTASNLLFTRQPRGVLLRPERHQRHTALEGDAGRRCRGGSHDAPGRGEAVHCHRGGAHAVCVWAEGVGLDFRCKFAAEY